MREVTEALVRHAKGPGKATSVAAKRRSEELA
jgi:hypothetical protein